MQKKILAVAVAGALALPGVALAQSSVTISGLLKLSVGQLKINNFNATGVRVPGGNNSEGRMTDDSSRIIFNVTEDLGGGLAAIGQVDWRVSLDNAVDGTPTGGFGAGGNTHIGLRSKSWGRLIFGRQDLHYFNRESNLTDKNDLKADSISLLAYAGGGGQSIANASRTPNTIHYLSPNWGGFTIIGAYSFNPLPGGGTASGEADINSNGAATGFPATGFRKGRGWNFNPNFQAANWQVGYSYWSGKPDNAVAVGLVPAAGAVVGALGAVASAGSMNNSADQRSDRLYGSIVFGGFKVGLAWDRSKLISNFGGQVPGSVVFGASMGNTVSNRTAWSLPLQYTWGPHTIGGHYTKARSDRATGLGAENTFAVGAPAGGTGCGGAAGVVVQALPNCATGATMWAIGYSYDLSKRTSLALTYARINNDQGAAYNFFTSAGAASLSIGSASGAVTAGEDPRMLTGTIRHAF